MGFYQDQIVPLEPEKVGRSCVDDERDDVVSVEFWSGGEANRLPAELVSDRAFVRLGIFWGHRSLRLQESKLFN